MMKFWNDNEGEHINNEFEEYLVKAKICHDINTPLNYPQHNEKVERRYHNHWKYAQMV
jgi:5S rRNA maturation endonuclease (ribonuclease M5)